MKKIVIVLVAVVAVVVAASIAIFVVNQPNLADSGEVGKGGDSSELPAVALEPSQISNPPSAATPARPSLESSDRYDTLIAAELPLAESGDAEAMNTISKALDYCYTYTSSPEKFRAQVELLSKIRPDNAAKLHQVSEKVAKRCELVNGGNKYSLDLVRQWESRAAEAGNLSALIRMATQNPGSISPEDRRNLVTSLKASGDANLVLEGAVLLAGEGALPGAAHSGGSSQDDQLALQVAACRLGANCAAGHNLMDGMCLAGGGCNYASYEDLVVREAVPSAHMERFQRKVQANIDSLKN